MPLTPAEVRHAIFSKAPVGTRGYHEDEVDSFMDRVHVELARLIEENNDLRHQLQQRDQQLPAGPVDTGGSSRRPSPELVMRPMRSPGTGHSSPGVDHNLQTALMLAWAQERADQVTEAANAEVDKMLNQARVHGAQLLSEAQAKAEDMVNEARTRVETMLHDARTTAQTVERQSREKATSLAQHAPANTPRSWNSTKTKVCWKTPSLICRRSNKSRLVQLLLSTTAPTFIVQTSLN